MQDQDHDERSGEDGDVPGVSRPDSSVAPAATYGYVSRQQIADADDITEEDVPVPEWGGKVRVRGLTGEQRDEFEGSIIVEKRDPDRKGKTKSSVEHRRLRAKLVVKSVVHPPDSPQAGQPMFDETDIGWIAAKSAAALDRVFSTAQRLSGMSDEDVDDLLAGFEKAGTGTDDGSTSA